MTKISRRELDRLRALAREQAEIAGSDSMKQLYADWARHGRFEKNARPMLTIELWTFADEIIPGMLPCPRIGGTASFQYHSVSAFW